jgi:pimeloyl-ACP methyl ester carboxylesterase
MTPNDGVFRRLVPLLPTATVINWFPPHANETLTGYAGRIAAAIPARPCIVAGVSFGGIVALEISRRIHPRACILISSIRHPRQLPPWLRFWRMFAGSHCPQWLKAIGGLSETFPRAIRTASTARLTKLAGNSGAWHRWATSAVLDWQPDTATSDTPVIQIHGSADRTFPIRYTTPDVVVANGGHVLPLTHADEVAAAMRNVMADVA